MNRRRAARRTARLGWTWTFGAGAWLALAAVAGWSCDARQEALGPEPGRAASLGAQVWGFSTDGLLAFLQPPDLSGPRSAGKLVRAASGGYVELNGFRVDIPAGALRRNTYVTIELPASLPEAGYVVADFGPSGLRFAKPVTVTLPLRGVDLADTSLDDVQVSYWNGSAWEDYGGTATRSSVHSTTTHFSAYGARAPLNGGIDTTSGG
ncbi:MAG: hypothetical protein ABR599_10505 [Gemmatimonadota bacterium]